MRSLPKGSVTRHAMKKNNYTTLEPASPNNFSISGVPFDVVNEIISRLHELALKSDYVFGSPLGPWQKEGLSFYLSRFVYFGPHTSDDAVRLAFLAGFDGVDTRGTQALLRFIERLTVIPEIGQGLNLSFFPLVNSYGLYQKSRAAGQGTSLGRVSWASDLSPEITLLRGDALLRAYHGFIRIETGEDEEVIVARMRGLSLGLEYLDRTSLISSEDTDPFPVRWETENGPATEGPLTLATDLPFAPFELTLRLPPTWRDELFDEAVALIIRNFVQRYRATLAHGINL